VVETGQLELAAAAIAAPQPDRSPGDNLADVEEGAAGALGDQRLEERGRLKARVREAIAQGYDLAFQGTPVIEPVPDDDEVGAATSAPRAAGERG